MYAVTVTFKLKPGASAEYLPLLRANARASLAEEVGCLQFDVLTDLDFPEEVFLYEVYETETAFQVHLDSPHFKVFDAAVATMVADKSVRCFR